MPIAVICDADGETVLTLEEAERAGWGLVRLYSKTAMQDVDDFSNSMLAAAEECQELFKKRLAEARETFHVKYPDGVLPDELPVEDEEDPDAPLPA